MYKWMSGFLILFSTLSFTHCEIQDDPPSRPDRSTERPDVSTDFAASAGFKNIQLVWTAGTDLTYLVIRSLSPITFEPKDGSLYDLDQEVESGETIIYKGSEATYLDATASEKITYYYKLFSYGDARLYSEGASAYKIPYLWSQSAFVKTPNSDVSDSLRDVAVDGDTVVIGSNGEDSNQTTITNGSTASSNNAASGSGAVYVLKKDAGIWTQQAYIKASNAEANDVFGSAVAIDGDTIVVGAYFEDSNQTTITNGLTSSSDNSASSTGAVYVYKRTADTWAQEAYLKAPNADTGDQLGYSVAISGDTIVASAFGEDSNQTTITNGATASADNTAGQSGAAYVYKRTGVNWAQQAYLKASNAEANDQYGITVAVSGDTVVVGANAEDSNQTTITNGATSSADNTLGQSGAAYVYKRTGTTWLQEAYLKAPNAGSSDNFGVSVAIDGDTIAVGALTESSNQTTVTNGATASADNSAPGAGAVYVFKRTGTTWAQEAYLKAPNAEINDSFGRRVSISGSFILVGAYSEDSNQTTISNDGTASADNTVSGAGAAYVFKRTDGIWANQAYLKASNAGMTDSYGYSVWISGGTAVVSAAGEDSSGTSIINGETSNTDNTVSGSGAVYIYDY